MFLTLQELYNASGPPLVPTKVGFATQNLLISIMVIPDVQIHAEEKSAGNSTNVLKEWQRLFTDRKSVEPLCVQINTFPVRVVFWA